jgi:hypothetical protein
MPGKWYAIAKAEFFAQTSRIHRWRKALVILLYGAALVWALLIAPDYIPGILDGLGPGVEALLVASFPNLMRSVMLFLWVIVLVYPISYALQEIQIGQWEIILSNNVSTRSMMFGSFMGKVPSYGLLVLLLAPVMLTPFTDALQVSPLGQAIMYLVVFLVALSTLFLSTLITTAIQAKIGDSTRGNDLAKALSMVVAVAVLVPMYGLIYFSQAMSAALGMDVFLLFPFTWGADAISWTIIIFNGIGVSAGDFLTVLRFNAITSLALLSAFSVLVVVVAFRSADRIFSFGAGPRTEKIVTITGENILLRKIRTTFPGPGGVTVVTAIKEFSRKMQNVSRLAYGVVLSVLLPVILSYSLGSIPEEMPEGAHSFLLMIVILMLGMMVAMISGATFGGIGFLESKDQLWIIKSAPHGVWKFAKARVVQSLLLAILIVIIPSFAVTIIFHFGILEGLAIFAYTYWVTIGAVLICIGITANNPAYENQKSAAFMVNTFASIFTVMLILMFSIIMGFTTIMALQSLPLFLFISASPMVVVGIILYAIGITRMSRSDTV